jgi:cyclopropane-fatty-acyl-phospholipid synthase
MSHEGLEPGRVAVYHVVGGYSDVLRSQEFSEFFSEYNGAPFSVRTLDGWSWYTKPRRAPQFTATFQSRAALDSVIGDAKEATLGRLYLEGMLDLEGNIFVLLGVAEYALSHSEGMSRGLIETIARISNGFARRMFPQKGAADQGWRCAPCPLELPVKFFQPWLGDFLGQAGGCFRSEEEDLDAAERNACERACERLELEPSDRLLDLDCGWGSLVIYAAERHGATARGVASSDEQAETSAERICRSRLYSRCTVSRRPRRLKGFSRGEFDKLSDLGIFEPVSSAEFGPYLQRAAEILAPGGLFLLDRMTRSAGAAAFIRSLEPDVLSDSLARELHLAEAAGFELVRVESLQEEYEKTLRVWIDRLLSPNSEAVRMFSRGYRGWMLYLVELAACLQAGEIQVHQVLLKRRG